MKCSLRDLNIDKFNNYKICSCTKLKNNILNGHVILFYNTGNIYYEGQWLNNMKHGHGILYDKYGNLEYDGEWENDMKNGDGILYYDKNKNFYNNTIFHNTPETFELTNSIRNYYKNTKIKYYGHYENGTKNGYGELFYINSKLQYKGTWENDMKHGDGILYNENGEIIYDGLWKNDERKKKFNFSYKCMLCNII
tara:strand:+ start:2436 stop:3020 length:585 start_codon:yes stop_codon:yes gene_type:complete